MGTERQYTERELRQVHFLVDSDRSRYREHDCWPGGFPPAMYGQRFLNVDGNVLGILQILVVVEYVRVCQAVVVAIAVASLGMSFVYAVHIIVWPCPIQRLEIVAAAAQGYKVLLFLVSVVLSAACKPTAAIVLLAATPSSPSSACSSSLCFPRVVDGFLACFVSDRGRPLWLCGFGLSILSCSGAPSLAWARHGGSECLCANCWLQLCDRRQTLRRSAPPKLGF